VKHNHYHFWEFGTLLFAFVILNILGAKFQKQISYNEGKGWEGVAYYQVAGQFAKGQPIAAEAPMVYRIGTPFLVSKVAPNDIFLGYKVGCGFVRRILTRGFGYFCCPALIAIHRYRQGQFLQVRCVLLQ